MLLTNRQDSLNNRKVFERQWCKEDKEFIAYALKTIENKKLAGNTIVPLYKVVEVIILVLNHKNKYDVGIKIQYINTNYAIFRIISKRTIYV